MATAAHIELNPATAGVYHVPNIDSQSCKIGSELLQQNHDNYHMYFNRDGFHNHIAHHLLTIFALGATPDELQSAFNENKGHQRQQFPTKPKNVDLMSDRSKFKDFLGKEQYFHDFEAFFTKEIDEKGWEAVLNEHLFAGDEHAERLLTRMFAGFYHPLIHLGFGVEFKQPAIIVEALAQAATHSNWIAEYLLPAEEATKKEKSSKNLAQLLNECRVNEKVRNSAHWEDGNKVRDGIMARAPEEMIEIASQWHVTPDDLERKTAEMINASLFFSGAAQRPSKQVKFDFYYMHCANSSIFFSTFLKEHWLSEENKCRMLQWKGQLDLAMYASRHSPELLIDEIKGYNPKNPQDGWEGIIRRVDSLPDDGHASKLIRAIANGEQACQNYANDEDDAFAIKKDMWLKLGHMVIDSVETGDTNWVRSAGFDQAWEKIPDRARL